MMYRKFAGALIALALSAYAALAAQCPDIPLPATPGTTVTVCHGQYASVFDVRLKAPRVVVYELTPEHAAGCARRETRFWPDPQIPAEARTTETAFAGSGCDKGHMLPAASAAWSPDAMHASFSLANVACQVPGLNRRAWEELEDRVRAWALGGRTLHVYVLAIFSAHPKRIAQGIAVPTAFAMVIVDVETREHIAFLFPNKPVKKGYLARYLVPIGEVERRSVIDLPGETSATEVWPAEEGAHRAAKRAECSATD